MKLRERMNKRCPRCNTKSPYTTVICPSCQLNFQKFEGATNADAKKMLKAGEKEQVLMRRGCPSDVKRWKLLLLAIFLGFTGAHHYYVGRVKMGLFYTVFFMVGVANAVITSLVQTKLTGFAYEIFTLLVLVWGAVLFMWIIDIAKISLNHYKVPVSRIF